MKPSNRLVIVIKVKTYFTVNALKVYVNKCLSNYESLKTSNETQVFTVALYDETYTDLSGHIYSAPLVPLASINMA